MERLEVGGAVRLIYRSLGVKGLMTVKKTARSVYCCVPIGRPNCKVANMAASSLVCGVLIAIFRDNADDYVVVHSEGSV